MKSEQEEMDEIIQDILEEDTYEAKFPEVSDVSTSEIKETEAKKLGATTRFKALKSTKSSKEEKQSSTKDKKGAKAVGKIKDSKKVEKRKRISEKAIQITRYVILGSVVLFFISLFLSWFTLMGNTTNYGFIRGEETLSFMSDDVQQYGVENLVMYEYGFVSFSPKELFQFSRVMEDEYLTVVGVDGLARTSIASKAHKAYMQSTLLLFAFTLIAILILAIFKRHKGITIVRNIAVFNGVIIGMNYLALKVPYFSVFAIRARDVLKQSTGDGVSMTRVGLVQEQVSYPYSIIETGGLYLALCSLGVWLLLSIVLSEVKNKEKESAIESGMISE